MKQFKCGCAIIATLDEEEGKIRVDVTALCPEHELGDFEIRNKDGRKMSLLNNSGKGFSRKKPNAATEIREPSGEPKILISDGFWVVPVNERPVGWEKMGGKEKECTQQ